MNARTIDYANRRTATARMRELDQAASASTGSRGLLASRDGRWDDARVVDGDRVPPQARH